MADGKFKIEVPISIKGGGSKGLAEDFTKSIKDGLKGFGFGGKGKDGGDGMGKNIGKIVASVGIIAAVWQGIAPILKPVLKMFNILLTLLLLPLMPLIRQMVSGLAKTAKKTREAQQAAGGTGFDAFTAGLGEVMKSPTIWAMAGAGLALSFAASLGTVGLAGTLAGLISLSLIWDSITNGDEKTLFETLKTAGWAGLSVGIAALLFGAGVYALPIGALTFSTALGIGFLSSAMKEEDLKTALLKGAAGSIMLGVIAGGVVALLGLGLGAAGVVTLSVGTLVFSLFAAWKFSKGAKLDSIEETLNDQMTIVKDLKVPEVDINWTNVISGLNNTEAQWMSFNSTMNNGLQNLNISVDGLGEMIGKKEKGSYPLVYSLIQAENEWTTMESVSSIAINKIIQNLNRIPRSITTTHYIRTVRI